MEVEELSVSIENPININPLLIFSLTFSLISRSLLRPLQMPLARSLQLLILQAVNLGLVQDLARSADSKH